MEKIRRKLIWIIILVIIIFTYFFLTSMIGNSSNKLFYNLKLLIPEEIKNVIKDNLFSKQMLKENRLKLKKIEDDYKDLQKKFSNLPNSLGKIDFEKEDPKIKIKIGNKNLSILKYNTRIINIAKFPLAKASAYIDFHQSNISDNILLVTGNGIISYFNLQELKSESFNAKVINNNIKKIIQYDQFYIDSKMGVKDILIKNNKLFISLTFEKAPDCFTTAIIYADINYNFLNFEKFFVPSTCVNTKNTYGEFNAHHSGGRIVGIDNQNIFFSIGEYRFRDLAQNLEDHHGKILKINLKNKNTEIVSMGHRNVQGMFFEKKSNTLYMTEHGPNGGDEININEFLIKTPNYGWPISSYGEHYGSQEDYHFKEKYLKAPLYKSHEKYNFIEPLTHFTPSIGISELLYISKDFLYSSNSHLLVTSMGKKNTAGSLGVHIYEITKQNRLSNHVFYNLNDRIRDAIILDSKKIILLWGESEGTLYLFRMD